jgi:hypothetical protein
VVLFGHRGLAELNPRQFRLNPLGGHAPRHPNPMLRPGDCLTFRLFNERYGAAVLLARDASRGVDSVAVAITRLALEHRPAPAEVAGADVLIINYDGLLYPTREIYVLRSASYQRHAHLFVTTGRIPSIREHDLATFIQAGDGWDGIPDTVNRQLAWELDCSAPTERLSVAALL